MSSEAPHRAPIFQPGAKLRDYVIRGLLGAGGMAEVYEAVDNRTGNTVALKVLQTRYQANPKVRERAIQEGQALSRLSHENLVRVLEVGLHGDSIFFIAMERLRGRTLASLIQNEGRLPVAVALMIAQQISDGVHTLHLSNLVHRDLKPANVFVTHVDGKIRAKILDLGAVKVLDKHGLTSEGSTIGTITYMAPEQTYGDRIGFYTDIYAIGLMLFEMLAGVHPGEASGARATKDDWIAWQRHQTAPDLKQLRFELPDMLVRLVHQCLRKDGSERAPSGGRLAIELRAIEDVLRRQDRLGPTTLSGWSDEEHTPHEAAPAAPGQAAPIGVPDVDRRLPYASTQETVTSGSQRSPGSVTSAADGVLPPESQRLYDTTPDALAAVLTAHGVPPLIGQPLPAPPAARAEPPAQPLLGGSSSGASLTEWRQVGPAPVDLKPPSKRRPFTARWDAVQAAPPASFAPETPPGVTLVKPAPSSPTSSTPASHRLSSAGRESQFGSATFLLFGVLLGLGAVLIGGAWVWWSRTHPTTPTSAVAMSGAASTPSPVLEAPSSSLSPTPAQQKASAPTSSATLPSPGLSANASSVVARPSPPRSPLGAKPSPVVAIPSAAPIPKETTFTPKWIRDPKDSGKPPASPVPDPSSNAGAWQPNW